MKLADQLRQNKYKLPPLPKARKPKPESEARRQIRLLKEAKAQFISRLNNHQRDPAKKTWRFLDIPVSYSSFDDIFESWSESSRKYDPLVYTLKKEGWFYKFLVWLIVEKFGLEQIKRHPSPTWDEDDRYDFRVRW